MADGVVQIGRAAAEMTGGTGQKRGLFPDRQGDEVAGLIEPDPRGQRPELAGRGTAGDPAHDGDVFLIGHLANQQGAELGGNIGLGNAERDALARSAVIGRHHQAGLFRGCAPADDRQVEGAAKPVGMGEDALVKGDLGFPDQRAIAKDPKRVGAVLGQKPGGQTVEIICGQRGHAGFIARIRFNPVDAGDELGCQIKLAWFVFFHQATPKNRVKSNWPAQKI